MVIYPEGVWYHYDNNSDIDQIIETHLIKGEIHQTLKLNQDKI
jgi:(2Fe-2S) ferredoxin